ncbi:putative transcriptional regulator YheO [Cytobacillus eiseniae]|uniref:Transcriptional regulator YheO n=1 Tax=Cytobacillus eiseniae TaxID=762947 RepID=A0ABS4RD10_9BACI|nr:PAS domain-containing protein [Cytobacillus eiseniae]MBP2240296.1 putative transcriptional regulator YheO [Cytobacillus eiseniae]
MKKSHQPIFDLAIRTADMLVKMFGSRCEVAVHDFADLKKSLIHIAGNVTGREIGSPITDLVLEELAKQKKEVEDIPNYKTQSKKGNIMKSATIFLRDDEAKVIGALCINYDISLLIQFGGELEQFINFDEHETKTESFFTSVQDVTHEMVEQVILGFKKAPSLMSLEEKVDCVRQLEEKGTFLIKGATDYVASVLGVSKFTVYNYLQKIRTMNEFQTEELSEQK